MRCLLFGENSFLIKYVFVFLESTHKSHRNPTWNLGCVHSCCGLGYRRLRLPSVPVQSVIVSSFVRRTRTAHGGGETFCLRKIWREGKGEEEVFLLLRAPRAPSIFVPLAFVIVVSAATVGCRRRRRFIPRPCPRPPASSL